MLVRGIALCIEHGAYGCSVDHFFSKHHPDIYHTYQMVYDGKCIEKLTVSAIANMQVKMVDTFNCSLIFSAACCSLLILNLLFLEISYYLKTFSLYHGALNVELVFFFRGAFHCVAFNLDDIQNTSS